MSEDMLELGLGGIDHEDVDASPGRRTSFSLLMSTTSTGFSGRYDPAADATAEL